VRGPPRLERNGVRFVIALALGLRQGEALGLKWSRLHEPSKTLEIMKGLQRQTWQHGCVDPRACGARYHKTQPCPKNCKRHQRPCPPPCPSDCTSHARWCPQRHDGGLVEVEVKSAAGRRGIALPDQLFALLIDHRKRQDQEREHAGTEWHEGGWMFTQPTGKPVDPRRDQYEWKALLEEAGVREARLHDARHTAATTLLLLGVRERAVMDVMGWSNAAMVKRYAHVTARLRRDIADRLNTFLWAPNETRNETDGG
jgi:integrase